LDGETSLDASAQTLARGASTILVVEDEDDVRRLIVDLLSDAGHDVLEAANAREAMAIAADHRGTIHLLLTDMVMPGLNGRKLAESLRDLHPESKVLLVSGYSESLVSADPLAQSIRYLAKPFTPEHLTRVVNEAIAGG
jgi:CheY-like chemotaxis protein